MKRIGLFCIGIFICTVTFAQTIRWHVGDSVYQTTTCESGSSITPPTPPAKNGYTFVGWEVYTPIEYLESTGTQWIDTGIVITDAKSLKETTIDFLITGVEPNVSTSVLVGGAVETTGSYRYTNTQLSVINNKFFNNGDFDFSQTEDIYKRTVATCLGTGNATPNITFLLFGRNRTELGAQTVGKVRIYACKIYLDNILVRDFIPVLDGNGTPCMFDKVEKKFYYNAGTGQFVAGPVIGG